MRKLKITELERLTEEEFKNSKKLPLVVVLDNVRSLHNVGSIFRTADAFLIEEIIICGITATPPHPDIHKTALGAENTVNWRYFKDTTIAIDELRKDGYQIASVEQVAGSTMLNEFEPNIDQKYAVVMGNEVKGVAQDIVSISDFCLEIPQFGTKHSLNVSVTAGLVIWHFAQSIIK